MARAKKPADPAWKVLDRLPKGVAAVLFYPDGSMQLMLPKHEAEEMIEVDSPTFRATMSGAIHLEQYEDLRVQMLERMDGKVTTITQGEVH